MTRAEMYERFRAIQEADFWKEVKHDASLIGEQERNFFLNEIMRMFVTGYESDARDLAQFVHGLAEAKKRTQETLSRAHSIHGRIPHPRSSS